MVIMIVIIGQMKIYDAVLIFMKMLLIEKLPAWEPAQQHHSNSHTAAGKGGTLQGRNVAGPHHYKTLLVLGQYFHH